MRGANRMAKHGLSSIHVMQTQKAYASLCKLCFLLGRVDHWMVAKVVEVAGCN